MSAKMHHAFCRFTVIYLPACLLARPLEHLNTGWIGAGQLSVRMQQLPRDGNGCLEREWATN